MNEDKKIGRAGHGSRRLLQTSNLWELAMKLTVKSVALTALFACASIPVSHTSQAAVLFQINNGAAVTPFAYDGNSSSNNVVNDANWTAAQQAALGTGSTVIDGSNTANWKATASGGPSSFVSVVGLGTSSQYLVSWTYLGSESGDRIQFSVPGASNIFTNSAITTVEDNRNSNFGNPGAQHSVPLNMSTTIFTNVGANIPAFVLTDLNTGGTVTNGGPNAAPNNGAASLIFSYANFIGGKYTLTSTQTDFVVFGFNDNGAGDDNHDDFMGAMTLVPCGDCAQTSTPIPGALPLFGSTLGGVLGLLGWRRKRKNAAVAAAI